MLILFKKLFEDFFLYITNPSYFGAGRIQICITDRNLYRNCTVGNQTYGSLTRYFTQKKREVVCGT